MNSNTISKLGALKNCFQLPGQSLREFADEVKELKTSCSAEEFEAFCAEAAAFLGKEID